MPSRPLSELADRLATLVERRLPGDAPAQRLVDAVADLAAQLSTAGLPTTLVHGDFHPGNWRSDGAGQQILDWGDAYVGHPAADIRRLVEWLPADHGVSPG